MKKREEITGLPVVSIEEGDEIGVVGHIIPNVINGSIAGLALEREVWHQQPLVIPFSFVVGMSSEALTIENKSAIYPLNELHELEDMLAHGNDIVGLRVITKNGKMLGRVTEYIIDDTGSIDQYQLEEGQDAISAEQVVTIGRKMLVVDADVSVSTPPPSPSAKEPAVATSETKKEEEKPTPAAKEDPPASSEAERLRQLVGENQEESILGKACQRTLMAETGAPIIRKGEEVTSEVVAKAKKANRFSELVESTRLPQT